MLGIERGDFSLQTIKEPPSKPQEESTEEHWHIDETEPSRQECQTSRNADSGEEEGGKGGCPEQEERRKISYSDAVLNGRIKTAMN